MLELQKELKYAICASAHNDCPLAGTEQMRWRWHGETNCWAERHNTSVLHRLLQLVCGTPGLWRDLCCMWHWKVFENENCSESFLSQTDFYQMLGDFELFRVSRKRVFLFVIQYQERNNPSFKCSDVTPSTLLLRQLCEPPYHCYW